MGKDVWSNLGRSADVLDLFGSDMHPGPAPAPSQTVAMPDADSEAVAAAKRRKVAEMKNRGGRASTILSGEDRLGG